MGALHAHEFITLDGVIDEPAWTAGYEFLPAMQAALDALTGRCTTILFGRRTYEMFEPAWSVRSATDDPVAPFFNDTPKYVVSSTLTEPTWRNSTAMPYDTKSIRRLKDESKGDLFTSASGTLVRALIADGLLDDMHLFVYPLTVGAGSRLFPDTAPPQSMELAGSTTFSNGVLYLHYRLTPGT